MRGANSFEPLDQTLRQPLKDLLIALRTLYQQIGATSARTYAAGRFMSVSTVSRSLNGKQMPTWAFVKGLFDDAAAAQSGDLIYTLEGVEQLYVRALEASDHKQHQVRLLQVKLADADRNARNLRRREMELQKKLFAAHEHIKELDSQVAALESGRVRALPGTTGVEHALVRDEQRLRDERELLDSTVQTLTRQLEEERARRLEAEEKCAQLEKKLEAAESIRIWTPEGRGGVFDWLSPELITLSMLTGDPEWKDDVIEALKSELDDARSHRAMLEQTIKDLQEERGELQEAIKVASADFVLHRARSEQTASVVDHKSDRFFGGR